MEDINVKVLDEVNKGATMGMDAIHFVSNKVGDQTFKKVLDVEYGKYQEITNRVNDIYSQYNTEKEPHETNAMNKVMTWYGIEMKTMFDKSNSKIAELLLQGTNMGIIEGRKLLNHKGTDKEVEKLVSDYVKNQEEAVEQLKKYL
jgi:hypothetical protein